MLPRQLPAARTRIALLARAASTAATARVVYPVLPPEGRQSGRIIDQQLFEKMSHIPPERYLGALPLLHDEEQAHEMCVGNGRSLPTAPSLAREGFELWDWPTSADLDDEESIRRVYYAEMESRVMAATGAEHVIGFHHLRRDAARDNRDSRKGPGGAKSTAGAAVFRAHSDYTKANALLLIGQLEAAGRLPAGVTASCEMGERAYGIINCWRGFAPVAREPRR